jgi:hypothetical protein
MCFGFGLFLPLSLIPAGGHSINGVQVTFEEFWRRGGGPIFFLAGILFPLSGLGFVRAQNWSRYLFSVLQFAFPVCTLFFGRFDWDTLFAVVWAAFVAYYLFRRPSVREYFGVDGVQGI